MCFELPLQMTRDLNHNNFNYSHFSAIRRHSKTLSLNTEVKCQGCTQKKQKIYDYFIEIERKKFHELFAQELKRKRIFADLKLLYLFIHIVRRLKFPLRGNFLL